MTVPAIIVMIIAIAIVWGGLVLAVTNLVTHPDPEDD